jgi:hypothetical protein
MEHGAFVPLNVGGDGSFQVAVRGGLTESELSDRESRNVRVSSQPYLLISHGEIALGGLESVGGAMGQDEINIPVAAGRYSVIVHLVNWKAEPGAVTAEGTPSGIALPDFLVEVLDELKPIDYRTNVNTFDRP